MIKTISKLIIIFTLFQSCHGKSNSSVLYKSNAIDSIQTIAQLDSFIRKVDDRLKKLKISESFNFEDQNSSKKYKKIADSLNVQPWTKADFDGNGLTDILVIGNWYGHFIICILDKADKYELKPITRRSFQYYTFPVVKNNKIKYYFESDPEMENWDKPQLRAITLAYKFGDFIEENKTPATHNISKIEYSTTGCYGTCPIFNLTIDSDRTSSWFADEYNALDNAEVKGNFHTTISQEKYDELISLLNYIDFENLKDSYAVHWTDDQSSTLKITYDNGKIKSIHDYGLIGTFGLDRVYQMIFELRKNQEWTE